MDEQTFQNPKLQNLINELVAETCLLSNSIKSVKAPEDKPSDNMKKSLEKISAFRGRPLFYPYVGSGLGRGPYVQLQDGSIKLDLINAIGVNILGHSHPELIKASVEASLTDVIMQGNLQPNKEYTLFGEKIAQLASRKSSLAHAWISTCGSVANENALKMARQKNSPARKIIALKGAFAGRTTMMAEITDNPSYRVGLPNYGEVLHLEVPESYTLKNGGGSANQTAEKTLTRLKELVAQNPGDIAAFMFEPVQGEGGFKVFSRDFYAPLLDFCKSQGIAVWADEVQTFTRTGELFCFEKLDIGNYLDLCTIAKTAQVAATLYTKEYNPQPGLIAGTFAGSSVALAAGSKILDILTEGNYFGPNGKIEKIHKTFTGALEDLATTSCKNLISDVGGLGLMVAFTPYNGEKEKTMALLKTLYKNGLIAFACGHGPYRIRFLLPAILDDQDIIEAKNIIEKSLLENP